MAQRPRSRARPPGGGPTRARRGHAALRVQFAGESRLERGRLRGGGLVAPFVPRIRCQGQDARRADGGQHARERGAAEQAPRKQLEGTAIRAEIAPASETEAIERRGE